jgi:hypothetical protein
MTALPAASDFTGTVTEGDYKAAMTDLRDFLAGLLGTDGTVATALGALGALAGTYLAKSSAYTVQVADRGRFIDATTGTWTLSLPAVASAGSGFSFFLRNSGSGVITVDPSGSQQIDGATTIPVDAGNCVLIICNGSAWISHRLATTTFRDNDFTLVDNSDATKMAAFQLSGISTGTTRNYTLPDIGASTLIVDGGAQTITGDKTITGELTVTDSKLFIKDNADPTKVLKLQLSGISPGTTRTITAPDVDGTLAFLASPAFTGAPRIQPLTVGTLPAATAGARGFVTDSNAALAAGHGNIVAAGGANFVPVYADGTNWRIG